MIIDLVRLPPCCSVLRLNHCAALYKCVDESISEKSKPCDDRQVRIKTDGVLEPVWSCGAALPTSLVDLLDTGDREEEEEVENKEG